jgi:lipopolysaccharide biosynthesis regulator YciM
MKGPESFEPILPNREKVLSLLRDRGINDQEVKDALIEYVRVLETISDAIGDESERVRVVVHMSKIYFEDGYKTEAIENLSELLEQGVNISDELVNEIYNALDKMGWEG